MGDRVDSTDQCVFCAIVAGTVPCANVAEDATTFAFMDIDPGSDGHLLVIPKRQSADLVDVSADDLAATTLAARRIAIVGRSAVAVRVIVVRPFWAAYGPDTGPEAAQIEIVRRTDSAIGGSDGPRRVAEAMFCHHSPMRADLPPCVAPDGR